ncbi:hypothetical protein BCV69DRAFT_297009 [Microstroma glucosiphilum]|uniref:Uncharacterized protein n=1 Tax=Pseudomicrostroma glucosiphilum TaxID=1684307 RepID=A0A316UCU6_9BASI|nr:hypothetical protein BCV69DRAFT_297009 [Pseudomicrostroma glucosiphilum]PWN23050.1 hypothetical protein BCV69DRAFT_297009 [Pseudomicrostroma glucosiphilum]
MVLAHSKHHLIKGLLKTQPLSHATQGTGRAAARAHLNARHQQCSESLAKGSSEGCSSTSASIQAFRNAAAKWASMRPIAPTPNPATPAAHLLAAARLARPFLALLRSIDFKPIVRGALGSLKGTSPAYQDLSHSFRAAQRAACQAFPRRAPTTPQYAFALRRPQLPASTFHANGLQTARNFSSGGPTLAQVITNAPLALRAAGDELSDESKKSRRAPSAVTATKARSMGPRRSGAFGEQQRQKFAFRLAETRNTPDSAQKAARVPRTAAAGPSVQVPERQQEQDFDFYFPEAPAPEPLCESEKIITTIVVPVDPDIAGLIQGPHPATPEGSPSLLGDGLWDDVQRRTDAYQKHRLRLVSVFRLLDELMGVPPYLRDRQRSFHATCSAVREEDLEYMPETVHNVGYKYRLKGYTANEVREALIDRLGVETGAWFAQLIREERLQSVAPPVVASVEMEHSARSAQEDGATMASPSINESWEDDTQSLPSLPESAVSMSISSWDGMLYSPPSLRLSSAFESQLQHPHEDEEDSLYLQDSRVGW